MAAGFRNVAIVMRSAVQSKRRRPVLSPDAEGVCTLESDETEIRVIHCPEAASNRVFLQQKIYPEEDENEDWLPRRLAVFVDKASEWKVRVHGSAETDVDPSQPLQMSGFIQV